jgi:hypothetical protein
MARRILNRKELRADYDAAERRKDDEEEDEEEEESDEEEEEEEKDSSEEAEEEGEEKEDDEEEAPPKKKKAPAKPKAKAKPRSRASKLTRMRVVWGVFNNSNQCVATYDYPKKNDAVEHATRLTNDKRSTHFVQPIKEPMEEKKEK